MFAKPLKKQPKYTKKYFFSNKMSGLVEELKEFMDEVAPKKSGKSCKTKFVRSKIIKTRDKEYPSAFLISSAGQNSVYLDSLETLAKTILEFPAELMHDWLAEHGYWLDPKGWYGLMPPGFKDVSKIKSKKEAAELLLALSPSILKYVLKSGPMLGYNLLFDTVGKSFEIMNSGSVYDQVTGGYDPKLAIDFGEIPKKADEIADLKNETRKELYNYYRFLNEAKQKLLQNSDLTNFKNFARMVELRGPKSVKEIPFYFDDYIAVNRKNDSSDVDLNQLKIENDRELNKAMNEPAQNNLFYKSLNKKYPEESMRANGLVPNIAQMNLELERSITKETSFKPIGHLKPNGEAIRNYSGGIDLIGGRGFTEKLTNGQKILKSDLVNVLSAITKQNKTYYRKMKIGDLRNLACELLSN